MSVKCIVTGYSKKESSSKELRMAHTPTEADAGLLHEIVQILDTSAVSMSTSQPTIVTTPLASDLSLLHLDPQDVTSTDSSTDQGEPAYEGEQPRQVTSSRSTANRMRLRDEIEYLREKVRDLEAQLVNLKPSESPVATSPEDESFDNTAPSSKTWQRVAKRQRDATQTAEAENAKLRELVQDQLKIVRGLERLVQKGLSIQVDVGDLEPKRRKRGETDEAVFNQLKAGLDDRYREVKEVFRKNGLATNHDDIDDVRVISSGRQNMVMVEIVYAKVLPFDFASTAAAVWKTSTTSYVKMVEGYYSGQASSDDVLTSRFETPATVRRERVTLDVYAATKRYRESEQREVYAWESWSIVRSSSTAYDGILLQNHGWIVIESVLTDDPAHPATTIQSCSRQFPDSQSLPKQNSMDVFNDVLMATYSRNYAMLYEAVENTLLSNHLRDSN